ncbi:hypothetical protein D3C75_669830 [compost metagenome]
MHSDDDSVPRFRNLHSVDCKVGFGARNQSLESPFNAKPYGSCRGMHGVVKRLRLRNYPALPEIALMGEEGVGKPVQFLIRPGIGVGGGFQQRQPHDRPMDIISIFAIIQ